MLRRIYWIFGLVGLVFIGCSSTMRQFTYGPDFKYLEEEQIHKAMTSMVRSVHRLEATLEDLVLDDQVKRQSVQTYLLEIEKQAQQLRTTPKSSNHPVFGSRLDAFLTDVARARTAAQQTPANYYWSGRIAGSCASCHIAGN